MAGGRWRGSQQRGKEVEGPDFSRGRSQAPKLDVEIKGHRTGFARVKEETLEAGDVERNTLIPETVTATAVQDV